MSANVLANVLLEAVTPGGYVSAVKAAPLIVLLLLWTRLLTWVDKDTIAAHLPRSGINLGFLAGLVAGYAAFFLLPVPFIVAFAVPVFIFLVEMGVYLGIRHKKVGLGDLKDQFK